MSEIEVGDYIRLEDGTIEKVTSNLKEFINEHMSFTEKNLVEFLGYIKHSKNIIDLICEGDYVNGYKIRESCILKKDVIIFGADFYLLEKDIKSIVTKEQFESIEYKV